MKEGRRLIAAVVGGHSASAGLLEQAQDIGRGLVDHGFRVATGGLGGVMEAALRGARSSQAVQDGSTIGILPGLVAAEANPHVDIAIPTGMNYARNTVLVAMSDVVVAIGGGAGTLSEIALAWQHNKPIVALDSGEGWSSRLAGETLDPRRKDRVHRAESAQDAVELAVKLAGSREASRGF
jgi:uncharacterized protein (TIGR00725 family)